MEGRLTGNLATRAPKANWPMIATLVRSIFEQPDRDATWSQLGDVVDRLTQAGFGDLANDVLDAADDILAFSAFPVEHWPQIRSNNPQERLNKEIRRRTDIVGIFPNRAAVIRLVGALLAEQTDEWAMVLNRCRRNPQWAGMTAPAPTLGGSSIALLRETHYLAARSRHLGERDMRKLLLVCGSTVALLTTATPVAAAPLTPPQASAACAAYFGVAAGPEPLSACQWDMRVIEAGPASYAKATGAGVSVGVIDGGVDFTHPDLAGAIDVGLSCSFIYDHDPTADPAEVANGDCSNKAAVQDLQGHGTHVATTIAGRLNGVGIAGVAPDATIVALKACTIAGYCFADSVAAALRYAGDQGLDVVNLSLFADPYLFYCKNDADQRAILKSLSSATKYAQQHGVVVVASAGNESTDLSHPTTDELSPDWPPDTAGRVTSPMAAKSHRRSFPVS